MQSAEFSSSKSLGSQNVLLLVNPEVEIEWGVVVVSKKQILSY